MHVHNAWFQLRQENTRLDFHDTPFQDGSLTVFIWRAPPPTRPKIYQITFNFPKSAQIELKKLCKKKKKGHWSFEPGAISTKPTVLPPSLLKKNGGVVLVRINEVFPEKQ